MKKEIFRGTATALVTPHSGGRIDYSALSVLIERQIAAGVEAIVIGGTTGEASTLTEAERRELFSYSREAVGGRAVLIFGTGANDTRTAVRYTEEAERIGCDAALVVTPYYNKGTREGVIKHFERIANSTNLPIILYNVPQRTGVDLDPESVARLAELDNIVAIKEAAGKAERLARLAELGSIALYSGNDSEVVEVGRVGGSGVISVLSNLCPRKMAKLTRLSLSRSTEAEALLAELSPLMSAIFRETNPAPIKYALSRLGLITGEMRLPMWEVGAETKGIIDAAISECGAE